jgi:hypothetical protein
VDWSVGKVSDYFEVFHELYRGKNCVLAVGFELSPPLLPCLMFLRCSLGMGAQCCYKLIMTHQQQRRGCLEISCSINEQHFKGYGDKRMQHW